MQNGGCRTNPDGTPAADSCPGGPGTFPGADFPFLSANVVRTTPAQTLFPPYVVKKMKSGVKIGFIGMTLKGTPDIVTAAGVQGLTFLDEVETANKYAAELQKQGVQAIVVLLHQGGIPASARLQLRLQRQRRPRSDRRRRADRPADQPGGRPDRHRPHPHGVHLRHPRPCRQPSDGHQRVVVRPAVHRHRAQVRPGDHGHRPLVGHGARTPRSPVTSRRRRRRPRSSTATTPSSARSPTPSSATSAARSWAAAAPRRPAARSPVRRRPATSSPTPSSRA